MRPFVLPAVLALTAIPPVGVHAETLLDLAGGGRYQLMDINDKIVRLDTETGKFDLCRMEDADWTCVATRDERAALEAKITALTRRIETLEAARDTEVATAKPSAVQSAPLPAVAGAVPQTTAPMAAPASVPAKPEPQTAEAYNQVADILPPVEVGRTDGEPMVIVPMPAAPEKPGLIKRITGMIPDLDW